MSLRSVWKFRAWERGFIVKMKDMDLRVAVDPAMKPGTMILASTPIWAPKRKITFINIGEVTVV